MDISKLVIHPTTTRQIEHFVMYPGHAVVLVAPEGSGKRALIRSMTARLLNVAEGVVDDYPYLKVIEPEVGKTSISIEAVRELQHFVSLKLPTATARRIIHIFEAQGMGQEAQNSLLKLLEEPPDDTFFLMTAANQQQLLPTVRSRTQLITMHRPSRSTIEAYFNAKGYSATDIASAFFLSGGLPGLMSALLDNAEHPLTQSVQLARQLLQMNQFERLGMVDELSKKKPETVQLLFILQNMARAAIEQASAKSIISGVAADRPIRQWHKVLRAGYDTEQSYSVSAQAKLSLTHLMLSL